MALPVVIIGESWGIFTATEAGVTAVVYALIVGFFVYRELHWRTCRSSWLAPP